MIAGRRASGRGGCFVVPVFLPHAGCPHRCVFCNQHTLARATHDHVPSADWRTAATDFLRFRGPGRSRSEIAFYGGTFLGLPERQARELLADAAGIVRQQHLDGIRLSTRPDSVSDETLSILSDFPVVTVELGVQSMSDPVLREAGRGHTAEDTVTAVARLRQRGYRVGLQIMVGLPGEGEEGLAETGRRVAELAPDFVRIYPTLVLAGSELDRWYRAGRYQPLPLDRAVALTAGLYRIFRAHRIAVVRTGLQATRDLAPGLSITAGPHHPAFGELVQAACFQEALLAVLRREPLPGPAVVLRTHPRDVSRVRGHRNATVALLKREFGWKQVGVESDERLARDAIALPDGRVVRVYRDAPDMDPGALVPGVPGVTDPS
jgi:histone acetyltransferase (RNA polymerase elongator complex component)